MGNFMAPSSLFDTQVNCPSPQGKILYQITFHEPLGFIFDTRIATGQFVLFFKIYNPIFFLRFQATQNLVT